MHNNIVLMSYVKQRNSHWRVQGYVSNPQAIKNGSGPGSTFPGKFDENSISVNPTMLPCTQNPVESDPSIEVPCKALDPDIVNKGIPLPMPLPASISAPIRSDGVLAHSLQGPVSDVQSTQCPTTSDTMNQQEELTIEGGTINISSAYSQGWVFYKLVGFMVSVYL